MTINHIYNIVVNTMNKLEIKDELIRENIKNKQGGYKRDGC